MKSYSIIFILYTSLLTNTAYSAEKSSSLPVGLAGFFSFGKVSLAPSCQLGLRKLLEMPNQPNRPQLLAICAAPTQPTEQLPTTADVQVPSTQEIVDALNRSIHHTKPTPSHASAEVEYDDIPEFATLTEVGRIIKQTIQTLNAEQPDRFLLQKLLEQWTTLGEFKNLSYEKFEKQIANNFRKVRDSITTDYAASPSVLGFASIDQITVPEAHDRFEELQNAFLSFKNQTGDQIRARTVLKQYMISASRFTRPGTFEEIEKAPRDVFLEKADRLVWLARQTHCFLREPIALEVFKSYCAGQDTFNQTTKTYTDVLGMYDISTLPTAIIQQLSFKNSGMEDEAENTSHVVTQLEARLV